MIEPLLSHSTQEVSSSESLLFSDASSDANSRAFLQTLEQVSGGEDSGADDARPSVPDKLIAALQSKSGETSAGPDARQTSAEASAGSTTSQGSSSKSDAPHPSANAPHSQSTSGERASRKASGPTATKEGEISPGNAGPFVDSNTSESDRPLSPSDKEKVSSVRGEFSPDSSSRSQQSNSQPSRSPSSSDPTVQHSAAASSGSEPRSSLSDAPRRAASETTTNGSKPERSAPAPQSPRLEKAVHSEQPNVQSTKRQARADVRLAANGSGGTAQEAVRRATDAELKSQQRSSNSQSSASSVNESTAQRSASAESGRRSSASETSRSGRTFTQGSVPLAANTDAPNSSSQAARSAKTGGAPADQRRAHAEPRRSSSDSAGSSNNAAPPQGGTENASSSESQARRAAAARSEPSGSSARPETANNTSAEWQRARTEPRSTTDRGAGPTKGDAKGGAQSSSRMRAGMSPGGSFSGNPQGGQSFQFTASPFHPSPTSSGSGTSELDLDGATLKKMDRSSGTSTSSDASARDARSERSLPGTATDSGLSDRSRTNSRAARSSSFANNTRSAAWARAMAQQSAAFHQTDKSGRQSLEMQLRNGDGRLTVETQRSKDRLSVNVGFTENRLRSAAAANAQQIQESLQSQFNTNVDLSLMQNNAGGASSHSDSSQPPSRASSAQGAEESGGEAQTSEHGPSARAVAAGAQHEWIG